jgi:hypothetical protein
MPVETAPPGAPGRFDDDPAVSLSAGHYDSFVVRVFSRGPARELIHGQVTHVATRRTVRFKDLKRVMAFIRAHVGQRPTPAPGAEPDKDGAT